MPDFSEILKIAVEQQDWQLICGLYTNITGEHLSVPQPAIEEEKEEEDVLKKDYSLEELRYQNQLPPQEQDLELVDKNIDNMISSRYNDFTAPAKSDNSEGSKSTKGRKMKSEQVGSNKLSGNFVGISSTPFVDEMKESLVDPDTGEPLVGNNQNVKITPRNKRKELGMQDTSLRNAECSSCGKSFEVSPSLLYGYSERKSSNTWKCNSCSIRKGRRG